MFRGGTYPLGFLPSFFPKEIGSRIDAGMSVALGVVFWPIMIITFKPHVHGRLCTELATMYMRDDKPMFGMLAVPGMGPYTDILRHKVCAHGP